ncbi:MAG TPA: SRPBCC family protein [Anaerolineales bacterium]
MIAFEKKLFISRPQQEVFEYVSNPANDHQWRNSVELVEWTSEGPPGVGSSQHQVDRFLGRKIDSTLEITSWDPPNQYGQKVVSGPIPFEVTITFDSMEGGTQLSVFGQAEFGGFFKMAEGLIGKQIEKQLDTELNNLKRALEEGQAQAEKAL